MKIFISPAKSLDLESDLPNVKSTQPEFIREASRINKVLKEKSKLGLGKLMNLSEKLINLN